MNGSQGNGIGVIRPWHGLIRQRFARATDDDGIVVECHSLTSSGVLTTRCTSATPRISTAEQHASVASAIAREHQLKRWSRKKNEALILDDTTALRSLGRRKTKSMAGLTWRDPV